MIVPLLRIFFVMLGFVSISRSELEFNQRYSVTGDVFNTPVVNAHLIVPDGFIVITKNELSSTQLITQPVTLHWIIEVTPKARCCVAQSIVMNVNGLNYYTESIRVNGFKRYLPLIYL